MSDRLALANALLAFAKASSKLKEAWDKCPDALTDSYPFAGDFDEVNSDIQAWQQANGFNA